MCIKKLIVEQSKNNQCIKCTNEKSVLTNGFKKL